MDQQMKEAVREAVQIQTDRLQDSLQRENDEFLRNIDENMKKVLKGLVKNKVKEKVSRILPRIEESVNATLEAEDQELRLSEEARIQEEEEANELYRDVNINQGRGLQVTQNVEDSHVTLTSYMTQQMTEAIREAVQIQTDRLQDSLQRENNEFLRNIDENMKKIIKGQVKNQVKEQVLRILPRIEESMNATLEAEVLTRSSHSSRTSYAIAADLSEMELKKILIEKIEGNKQKDDDQEGPSAGSDRGSKRQKEGGEHASASTPSETATGGAGRSTKGSQSRQLFASESAFAEEPPRRPPSPDRDWTKTLPAAQGDAQSWISDLARQTDAQ
nr:hypothetical protein [Tanacetum cinerariifolium]